MGFFSHFSTFWSSLIAICSAHRILVGGDHTPGSQIFGHKWLAARRTSVSIYHINFAMNGHQESVQKGQTEGRMDGPIDGRTDGHLHLYICEPSATDKNACDTPKYKCLWGLGCAKYWGIFLKNKNFSVSVFTINKKCSIQGVTPLRVPTP